MTTGLEPLLLAALSGAVVAGLLTVFGGGGSVLAVPLLLYLVGVQSPHVAIGASAAGAALNALTALAGQALLLLFAFAMAAVAAAMLRPRPVEIARDIRLTPAMAPRLAVTGGGVGLAAGFFGIGGGFLIVPGLMVSAGLSLAAAQAASLVSVAAFGAATALNYAASGLIDWAVVAAMAVGGVAGTLAGLPIARRLGDNAVLGRRLFAGLILVVAAYVAVRAVSAL